MTRRGPWQSLQAINIETDVTNFSGQLSSSDVNLQVALETIDAISLSGSSISLSTTNFAGLLSATEDTVQKALDVLDDHTHAVLESPTVEDNIDISDGTNVIAITMTTGSGKIKNDKDGGTITISGEIAGDIEQIMVLMDPAAAVALYYNGSARVATTAAGMSVTDGTATAATIGFSSDDLVIDNNDVNGLIILKGEKTGPSEVTLASFNPDGAAELYYAGTKMLETTASGVQITGADPSTLIIGNNNDQAGRLSLYPKAATGGDILFYLGNNHDDNIAYFQAGPVEDDFVLQTSNGQTILKATASVANMSVELYFAGVKAMETKSGGINVFDSSASGYLQISHTGSGGEIYNPTNSGGVFIYNNNAASAKKAVFGGYGHAGAYLYYAGTQKMSTDADGIAMVDAGKMTWDQAPATDDTGTGDQIGSETVDQNTVGVGGCLRLGSDGNWDDADKDAATTVGMLALAIESGTGSKKLLFRGFFRHDSWNWTPGAQLYVGDSGAITNDVSGYTTGDIIQVVGYAKTADIIYFNPSPDYVEVV